MEGGRKRVRPVAFNGGAKRPKATDSIQMGVASKLKPCMKFFSTSGCPFGESCHFEHYLHGGYQAVLQMTHSSSAPPKLNPKPNINFTPPNPNPNFSQPQPSGRFPPAATKTKLCSRYNSAEGCKFGERCNFAHGERELGKPVSFTNNNDLLPGSFPTAPPMGPQPGGFGASATAKISVQASLSGAIIGKGGINTKQICRTTGVKLAIRDHESDLNLKNIELEGTFDQINHASSMVRELIVNVGGLVPGGKKGNLVNLGGNNFKTKLCEKFAKGVCTFGDKCHFAHGSSELRHSMPAV